MRQAARVKQLLVGLSCLLAGLLAFTWWALESSGVAVLTTQGEHETRSTHVWFVEDGNTLLIEAGAPENGWFEDVRANPRLAIAAPEIAGAYLATPLPNPSGHDRV
ncbi:MAG: nitroreductase/quinone reductase family protein, partial [Myxococcota bacterium]